MFKNRGNDESGGAISLWVVLMVPVASFAAVVAVAGPQRMAAESSMEEAAGDLATLAVVLRDGRGADAAEGEIEGFLPDCPQIALSTATGLDPYKLGKQQVGLEAVCNLLLGDDADSVDSDGNPLPEGYLRRDLGNLGINTNQWEGFYSDSVAPPVACQISDNRQTRNAVYVAVAGDWEDGGWAAAQAWPDGVRVGSEVVARLNQDGGSGPADPCGDKLELPLLEYDPPRTVFSD